MSTLKEIAEATGVSAETVSRVVSGKYKGRTKKSRELMRRVLKEADKLDYRPNNAARAMRTQSTGLIGVAIDDSSLRTHPVFSEVIQGANKVLKEAGYVLTISSLNGIEESTLESRIFKEKLLDGLIIMDNNSSDSVKAMQRVLPNCVMVNTNAWQRYNCVRRNETAAGTLAATKLLERGYRQAFYFEGHFQEADLPNYHYSVQSRYEAFSSTFTAGGGRFELVHTETSKGGEWLAENRDRLTHDSVIVAASNLWLFCLMSPMTQLGFRVGHDFGLMTLDDESGLLATYHNLSRISFPRAKIGEIAGQMIVDQINGNKQACKSIEVEGKWLGGSTTPALCTDVKEKNNI